VNPPKVSVVVPHYQDLEGLDRCLTALVAQTYPADDFEIVVADNSSPAGEAAVAAVIRDRARLVIVAERGAGPARNGGVMASRGEILAFTDSDCIPDPDWLVQGIAALGEADFVGGAMKVLVHDPDRMTQAEAFESVFAFDNRTYVHRKNFTVTANLICPRALFDRVGGFKVGVSEDMEWSHRARDVGYRIGYASTAVVGHPARRTWAELQHKWRRLDAEMYEFHLQSPGGRLRRMLHSFGLPASAVAHSPRVLTSAALTSSRQRVAALAMLYRLRFWRFADTLRLALTHRVA